MLKKLIMLAAGVLFVAGCQVVDNPLEHRSSVIKAPEVAPGATYVGSETCLGCHEDMGNDKYDIHMKISSAEVAGGYQTGCEACHGPGSIHVDNDGDTEKILNLGPHGLDAEEIAGVCTQCHTIGGQMNWPGSTHAEYDISCTKCHKIHGNSNKNLLSEKKEPKLCAQCHQDVMAQMYLMSHHPVKEGKMTCSDCHNAHGSQCMDEGMLRTDERLNDLCLTCHTRYQGPFVFEHDPVVENCLMCHDPHGTVANNLLQQQEPFLCLQCHEAHFHAARASNNFDASPIPGKGQPLVQDPGRKIQPTEFGFQKSFMTKCTQCHQQVHGSDMPSQTVTSGHGLTR